MVSFPSPSVRAYDTSANCPREGLTKYRFADTVDQILARTNDAGQFDELETVWMLSA